MEKTKRIRILYILPKPQQGGAETQLLYLIKGIDKRKFSVYMGFFYDKGELNKEFSSIEGVEVIYFKKKKRYDVGVYFRIAEFIKSHQIDIVHSFLGSYHAVIPSWISRISIPVGGVMSSFVNTLPPIRRLEKFSISKYFAKFKGLKLVSCSHAGADEFLQKGFPKKSVYVIPNGIDYERFCKGDKKNIIKEFNLKGKFIIGTVGRLAEVKDHELLIKVFKEISDDYRNTSLIIVGGGQLMERLQELIKELDLGRRVILTGNRKDVPDILAAMNIFVLTSRTEGWPNALGEAMSAGLPSVSFPVGDVKLVIKNGENGIIVNPDADALKSSIISIMKDKRKMKILGTNARKTIENKFSVAKMVRRYEEFYYDLVEKKKEGCL